MFKKISLVVLLSFFVVALIGCGNNNIPDDVFHVASVPVQETVIPQPVSPPRPARDERPRQQVAVPMPSPEVTPSALYIPEPRIAHITIGEAKNIFSDLIVEELETTYEGFFYKTFFAIEGGFVRYTFAPSIDLGGVAFFIDPPSLELAQEERLEAIAPFIIFVERRLNVELSEEEIESILSIANIGFFGTVGASEVELAGYTFTVFSMDGLVGLSI